MKHLWLVAAAGAVVALVATRNVMTAGHPTVTWHTGAPAQAGLSQHGLDSLRADLANRSTRALLIVRNGTLVYEWYRDEESYDRHGTAALAKAVVGTIALLSLVESGVVGFDDQAATYIPAWRADPLKSSITLQQLASHGAGLDDVYFPPLSEAEQWFSGKPEWTKYYFEHPAERFRLALTTVPLVYAPGTAYRYSGVGYYGLSYALSSALRSTSGDDDLRRWLARRVYEPLGIPPAAWRMSYGKAYSLDGLSLFAIGSGAAFTPRALARIGQYVLDHYDDPAFQVLHPGRAPASPPSHTRPDDTVGVMARAVPHLGWWGNDAGAWPSLPEDALVGLGAHDQILLVVPSLGLVLARVGWSLAGDPPPAGEEAVLEELLFAPLVRTLQPLPADSSTRSSSPEAAAP